MDGGGKSRLEQAAEDAGSARPQRPQGVQSHLHIHVRRSEQSERCRAATESRFQPTHPEEQPCLPATT